MPDCVPHATNCFQGAVRWGQREKSLVGIQSLATWRGSQRLGPGCPVAARSLQAFAIPRCRLIVSRGGRLMRGLLKILALLVVGAAPINASEPPKPLIFLASQSGKQTLELQ